MIKEGVKAPNIQLKNQFDEGINLKEFLGKKVVIYFYPKDHTPGCTKEAKGFAHLYSEIKALGAQVIGISKDTVKSHENFAQKYDLPFFLLSDPDHTAANAYGVRKEKMLYGKTVMGTLRNIYIIDEQGFIEKIFEKVKPAEAAQLVVDYLQTEKA
ncbi:MAG: thioredoxin-dependent thiol peroxidase [Clostridiales bacterium]|nr:thioredoxin-dependent thiol peroxidase [Clostridiales bacterium]